MEPVRALHQKRLILIVVLTVALLLSSWFEDEETSNGSPRSAIDVVMSTVDHVKEALTSIHTKSYKKKEESNEKSSLKEEDEEIINKRDSKAFMKYKSDKPLRSTVTFDLYSCLPRFICEVHAVPPGARLTDLENDFISLFKNYVILSPGSPVYNFQFAAHMGQLFTGFDPSPCHTLYSSCPLSRIQLLDILASDREARRMFS